MDIKQRIIKTEDDIKRIFDNSLSVMLEKNSQRGDCWRNSGLLGQFIEIHSMYFRLRNLIWEIGPPILEHEYNNWEEQVRNALEDLRNFTMLGELCLIDDNFNGDKYVSRTL